MLDTFSLAWTDADVLIWRLSRGVYASHALQKQQVEVQKTSELTQTAVRFAFVNDVTFARNKVDPAAYRKIYYRVHWNVVKTQKPICF